MKLRALEVSEVNSYIKRILSNDAILYNLKIKGEISNFKVHSSKNVYLTLKDQSSKISCVIFKSNYDDSLGLEDGTKVIATGYISVYERDGSYQLYIESIEIDGVGSLYLEFNKLKEKLSKEGIFELKISLATSSSLKDHNSSIDPPPRPIIIVSTLLTLLKNLIPSHIS